MPAIDIARLRTQSAVLVQKFDQPAAFVAELHNILDLYAERTVHQRPLASPISILPAYRVPLAVMRQMEMELSPLAATFPEQAMALTDTLWQDGYLECRMLAANLLGKIHPETPTLLERITTWVARTSDEQLRMALLRTSLTRIRQESTHKFLHLMRIWFDPSSPKMWASAIHAVIPLIEDPKYENLPPIYNFLSPVIKSMPSIMQNDLADLINALYKASPVETIHFLRQNVVSTTSRQLPVSLRRILPQLPSSLRPIILDVLRQKSSHI